MYYLQPAAYEHTQAEVLLQNFFFSTFFIVTEASVCAALQHLFFVWLLMALDCVYFACFLLFSLSVSLFVCV